MGETFTGESGVPRSERVSVSRQIEFNAREHRHLDHGYAVTSHSPEGLTAERVLVHADTNGGYILRGDRSGCKTEAPRRFADYPIATRSRRFFRWRQSGMSLPRSRQN
jgi:hypothetical protein